MSRCAAATVSSTLNQDVESKAILIDRAPKPVLLAGGDRDDDLIHICHLSPRAGARLRI